MGYILLFSIMGYAISNDVPAGPYQPFCPKAAMNGTTLVADCLDTVLQKLHHTQLANAANCKGNFTDVNGKLHALHIDNIDGSLRCVISSRFKSGDNPIEFDVISLELDDVKNGVETKLWRIDRPEVWSSAPDGQVEYPMITFRPGDTITISAGGCVQTGGFGSQTWKSYTNPKGKDSPQYYWGTVFIKGVTAGVFKRIGELNGSLGPLREDPNAKTDYILRLGYQDDNTSDNGYWNHDDGNEDQCKGIGPAFVEIKIISGKAPTGMALSPHSKPFDLVWDMNNDEDENGLALNPQWNYALENEGLQPHLKSLCSAAFPSAGLWIYPIDIGKLEQTCTSMSPSFDLDPKGAICGGDPFPGHMNFGIAAYQGQVTWEGWSGNGVNDNDWNFRLAPVKGAGLAGQGDDPGPAATIGLEFDFGDVDFWVTPWWHDLVVPLFTGEPMPSIGSTFAGPDGNGLEGIVIGEIGLDGVHGAYAESHPVFAIAVRTSEIPFAGGVNENWSFFLRNFGDEGGCSTLTWNWESPTGDYFIQLRWPQGATDVSVISTVVAPWQNASTPLTIEKNTFTHATLIHAQRPRSVDQFGLGGTITLQYTVPGGFKKRSVPAQKVSRRASEKPETNDLSGRITDPAVRAKYVAAVEALAATGRKPAASIAQVHLSVPLTIAERKHIPGAASRGQLTRAKPTPNLAKQQFDKEMMNIMRTYQTELKLEVPATLPPVK
jgi:hypothetical protein